MGISGLVIISVCAALFLLSPDQADARTNYDVGVTLSKTCITMIKNNMTTTCPTYEAILALFPDNTNQYISGEFVYKDGYLQRDNTQFINHFKFYTYQPVTTWIDPPGDILGRIATITIEPKLPEYLIEESQKLINNTMTVGHSRYMDEKCYRATISATDWIFLTGDTLNYMFHNCDKSFTSFNHIKSKYMGESYQNLVTSSKYKLDQFIKDAKEKYKVSYIGKNDIVNNKSVLLDEDEQ